ncbi:MAG: helix-turn-helix domain-containing protein [Thermoleophilia bacterium]|nr:helix-turn-helix domain-containing protein [Thermoleophilia bacterium]
MFEIGSTLREARTRQGLVIDEMESRTKVRARYLRFMEEDRFEQLPGHTYAKGFLKVYAEALGLDGQLFVDEYNSRYVDLSDQAQPRHAAATAQSGAPGRTRRQRSAERESRTVAAVLLVVVIATTLVIGAWRFGAEDAPSVVGLDTVTVTETAAVVSVVVEASKGSTFVEVRLGSRFGKPLYSGTLARGAKQRFTAASIYLAVERPRLVTVRVDGRVTALVGREMTFGAEPQSG